MTAVLVHGVPETRALWGPLLAPRVLADEFARHDTAQLWQTPGAGEEFMDGMVGASADERAGAAAAITELWAGLS